MIGSVLFYGFYPLSRLFASRHTEPSQKDPTPALVNGTVVCDGGAVTACQFTHCQTARLEEQLPSCGGSCEETQERMSVQSEEDAKCESYTEQGFSVLLHQKSSQDQTALMMAPQDLPETSRNQSALTTALEDLPETQHEVKHPEQEDTEAAPACEQNSNEGCFSPAPTPEDAVRTTPEDAVRTTPEEAEEAVCECLDQLQTEDYRETWPPQPETPCLKELLAASEDHKLEVQFVHGRAVSPPVPPAGGSECWDEYIIAIDASSKNTGGNHSNVCLVPPDCSTDMSFPAQQPTQSGYHFAVGPGLTNEVQCPLWQYPTLSYYPTMEQTLPFEVMWRVWEDMNDSSAADTPALVPFPFKKTEMDFSVMSYNILSQDLLEANQDLYTHCPLEVLEWSYRSRLLLEEIHKWAPDILCLQEVQENHFYQQFYPVLTQMGYTCVYKRRTGTKTDGCATCYRSSCFTELSIIEVEYFRTEIELLDRHNVAIIVLLRPMIIQGSEVKAQGPPLCVANTHLLFNPRRGDIKLAQLAILLAEIDKVVKSCKRNGENCNIVLCGDFNSVPHTPLYQLITEGDLYFQGLPAWMISGQEDLSYKSHVYRLYAPLWPDTLGISDCCQYTSVNQGSEKHKHTTGTHQYSHEFLLQLRFCSAACQRPADLEMIPGVTDVTPDDAKAQPPSPRFRHFLSHGLNLQSVYKHVLPGSGTAEVTTLHSQVGATVDYIFYSPKLPLNTEEQGEASFMSSGLKAIGCLSLLSEDVLWSMNGLPSHMFPSDHLSLLAKFQVDIIATT
ncbi:protein angel homolog 1 [Boleophthalmus pectinirostris]|uniref:protein angel homolog 1 n=1 Tax=Boleophthalmus pectinirostris TaxID=150288 RepID=UPI00242B2511|nr:protein angel homolog 1 [Boleophthalmus pectinirostris]